MRSMDNIFPCYNHQWSQQSLNACTSSCPPIIIVIVAIVPCSQLRGYRHIDTRAVPSQKFVAITYLACTGSIQRPVDRLKWSTSLLINARYLYGGEPPGTPVELFGYFDR